MFKHIWLGEPLKVITMSFVVDRSMSMTFDHKLNTTDICLRHETILKCFNNLTRP